MSSGLAEKTVLERKGAISPSRVSGLSWWLAGRYAARMEASRRGSGWRDSRWNSGSGDDVRGSTCQVRRPSAEVGVRQAWRVELSIDDHGQAM